MYARVTFAQAQPGKLHETIGLLRDTLYPALKEMEGFEGAFLLTEPGSERVCGITLWESEDRIPRVTRTSVQGGGRATRRFFEAPPLEQLATIPLVGQPGREVYLVAARDSSSRSSAGARASVMAAQALPGKMDSVVEILSDSLPPAALRLPGFHCYLALSQPGAGVVLAVTIWESEAHAADWDTGPQYRRLVAHITPLLDGPPQVDRYNVSVSL